MPPIIGSSLNDNIGTVYVSSNLVLENDFEDGIDGGLSLLVAGGIGYGVRKIREKRKKQQAEQMQK